MTGKKLMAVFPLLTIYFFPFFNTFPWAIYQRNKYTFIDTRGIELWFNTFYYLAVSFLHSLSLSLLHRFSLYYMWFSHCNTELTPISAFFLLPFFTFHTTGKGDEKFFYPLFFRAHRSPTDTVSHFYCTSADLSQQKSLVHPQYFSTYPGIKEISPDANLSRKIVV